ncbi:MAG TPA: OsmC family protein [Xanthomonadales bacterium]|nr:OsmC family protein [Xanthomonadales bacterium]
MQITAAGLESITSAPPVEFDGPGDRWSPETLLIASIADCYVMTFQAIARASHLEWKEIRCEVEGLLDRVDRITRFTGFDIHATLSIPESVDEHKARQILEKSESACLISNSLTGEKTLHINLQRV